MIILILGVFHHFCKSARSASRQREKFMESLHSDCSATYLLIIWVEKIIPLGMKSKQKPYPSIVFLSIFPSSEHLIILRHAQSLIEFRIAARFEFCAETNFQQKIQRHR